jgi:hypothetical protein
MIFPHPQQLTLAEISEIGVGLAGFGVSFLFLGILLLFDKGLLAIGNVSTVVEIYLQLFRVSVAVPQGLETFCRARIWDN